MAVTSVTLLDRLRDPADSKAWERFDHLYRPFIFNWLRRQSLQPEDAEDLTQDVMTTLIQELPRFHYDKQRGSFRSWLLKIAMNRLAGFWRSRRGHAAATGGTDFQQLLNDLQDQNSQASQLWNAEHDRHVTSRLLEMIEPEFEPTTWQAFRRVAIDGEKPAVVATELGMTVNAVTIAKHRVIRRLRQEIAGLTEL